MLENIGEKEKQHKNYWMGCGCSEEDAMARAKQYTRTLDSYAKQKKECWRKQGRKLKLVSGED